MFYKGWVPTVNGRLSFKLIGETRYPREPEYVNSSDESHLYVAARQSRQLSDVLFEPILGPLLGFSGAFECVFCARARRAPTVPDSKLVGKIFLFHRSTFRESRAKEIFSSSVRSMRALDPGAGNPGLRPQYIALSRELAARCDLSVNVVLNRDGVVTLSHIEWRNNSLRQNTIAFADEIEFDLEHGLADQMFFYLRDLTHQHQHHGNDADTITTTQRLRAPNDMSWSLEIMYSLYYHIITVKRKENPAEHVRALGILAYLQSYKTIIKRRAEKIDPHFVFPNFDDTSSKESIKATKDYIDLRLNEQKKNSDNQKAFLLWVVATTFTVINFTVSFADKNLQPSPLISSTANFLKQNAYVLPSLALITLIYFLSNLIMRPRYDFKRDVVRLTFVWKRPWVVAASGLAGLAALAAGIWYWLAVVQT
ncbi:hypothetical protein [Rhizobium leguminosarum]|uniref:hypothetical protein n=1 Tax=Rhizobium leguminosarum TaxID=384 RepID=UPI001C901F80|nr:hypothetical protein [Rhizobium leguminosarum]MBY2969505.1 hypothetical protein [Rhizobium leguminosarum]MBY2976878.1 hypothetical protein [Rhizobium leguminosarum]MBY3005429.1 hypothetical protein [Rhizobium leguminosarum]